MDQKKTTSKNRKKKPWKRYLALLPALLWMALIFYMSSKNGDDSASMSGKLTEWITSFLEKIRKDSIAEQLALMEQVDFFIRKLAHMAEYGILFLWICFAIKHLSGKTNKSYQYILSLVITFFYACTDEIHQLFVNGRYGTTVDVLIDMVGAVIALLCLLAFRDKKWRIIASVLIAMLVVFIFIYLILAKF